MATKKEGETVNETAKTTDTELILEAIKELTKTVADMAKQVNEMNTTHNKWVRAGKF